MDTRWGNAVMDDMLLYKWKECKNVKGWINGELSYPWWRAEPGASMHHLGGAPGGSGWSFSPAGASGIPWSVETGRGRGGGGRTRRTEGTEGAGRRKRLEGVGDLEVEGRERGERRREEGCVRQNKWQWLTMTKGLVQTLMSRFQIPLNGEFIQSISHTCSLALVLN